MATIKVKFQTSALSAESDEMAEKAGMMILASDFLGDKRVGKPEIIKRISKASIPILFVKTKTGGYLALNPSSQKEIRVPITSLLPIEELQVFLDNKANIEVNKVYKKLMQFKVKETILRGGLSKNDLDAVYTLLDAERLSGSWEFTELPPIREQDELNADIEAIDSAVYDKKRLETEINKRISLVDNAFKDVVDTLKNQLTDREKYWKEELKRLKAEETTKLKERDEQLKKDLEDLKKKKEKAKKENLKGFVAGVAKNIRKDEKDIEKYVQELEKLTTNPGDDPVSAIENTLSNLEDATDTFRAAISFAKEQVTKTRNRESDIDADYKLDKEDLERKCEIDKEQIRQVLISAEKQSKEEIESIKRELTVAQEKYSKFLSLKDQWVDEIEKQIQTESAPMIEPERFKLNTAPGKTVKLLMPIYIFQYGKKNKSDTYTYVVPPVKLPDSLKKVDKNSIFGKHKAMFYYPLHPKLLDFVDWIPKSIEKHIAFRNAIEALPNLVDMTTEMRNIFFESKPLLINFLHMPEKAYKGAAQRLSGEVIAEANI